MPHSGPRTTDQDFTNELMGRQRSPSSTSPSSSDGMYTGGTPNFDESTGLPTTPTDYGTSVPQPEYHANRSPSMPPSPDRRVPPAARRYATGQKMMDAYSNNWNPNPMIVRIMEGMRKGRK